jgi:hypothetical protein
MTANPPGEPLKPGIYADVPYDIYSTWPAINHSRMRRLRDDTPAHARWEMLNQQPPAKALNFGWAVHVAVLEPDTWEQQVLEVPKVDRRTKEGKLHWAAFERKAEGRMLMDSEQMAKLRGIRDNMLRHPTARELLLGAGQNEVSLVWRDQETGVLCKGRLDRMAAIRHRSDLHLVGTEVGSEIGAIVDVKTIGDPATLRNFERSAYDYGYFEQAAMYSDALQAVLPSASERPFLWIACETQPPHAIRVFQPDELGMDWGRQEYRRQLAIYKRCAETGVWPAWEDGLETCSVPAWVGKVYQLQQ